MDLVGKNTFFMGVKPTRLWRACLWMPSHWAYCSTGSTLRSQLATSSYGIGIWKGEKRGRKVRASSPRLCRFPTRKSVCRTSWRSCEPPSPLSEAHVRHSVRTVCFLSWMFFSWNPLQQPRGRPGIIIDCPGLGKGSVQSMEVLQLRSKRRITSARDTA